MAQDISEENIYAIVAGNPYEFNRAEHTVESVRNSLRAIVSEDGVFEHTSTSGIVTMLRLSPGIPVQVIPGAQFKRIVQEQRFQQMQAQGQSRLSGVRQ